MLTVYTDGACKGNPGRGAWAFCFLENGKLVEGNSGLAEGTTTNNKMELQAIYEAIIYFKKDLHIHTDSQYCVGIFEHNNKVNKNKIIVDNIYKACHNNNISIKLTHVKGHSGVPGNELADKMCNNKLRG